MARTSKVVPFGESQYGPLQLQRKTFRIIGYYPGDSGFLHWAMMGVFVFHYWFQIQLSYWEIRYGWIKMREGDVLAALEGICPTPSRIDAILKCLILIGERKKLKVLLDKLVELHDRKLGLVVWMSLLFGLNIEFYRRKSQREIHLPMGQLLGSPVHQIRANVLHNDLYILLSPSDGDNDLSCSSSTG